MKSKITAFSLIVMTSALLCSCEGGSGGIQGLFNAPTFALSADTGGSGMLKVASQLESITDKLYSQPLTRFKPISNDTDAQSCDSDDTGVITIFSTNGMAQDEIDVTLDGSDVGSLKTYFPDDGPSCKTPSAEGIITLMVPAGKHTIEAVSGNISWPSHAFSVKKCGCTVLPLS